MFAWKRLSDDEIVQGQSAATAEDLFENAGFGAVDVDKPIKGFLAVRVIKAPDGALIASPSGVVKSTISMTVFLPANEIGRLNDAALDTIQYEITDGSWIAGSIEKSAPVEIARENLEAELKAIGNADGSFFDEIDIESLSAAYHDPN